MLILSEPKLASISDFNIHFFHDEDVPKTLVILVKKNLLEKKHF